MPRASSAFGWRPRSGGCSRLCTTVISLSSMRSALKALSNSDK